MLKRLGKLLGREGGGETPRLRAAVFGKHPGWADHMEEIGLETPGLVDLRRALYSEGIARVVDSGAWEALDDADRLERIEHTFVRRWKGTLTIGRLWSSEDGRGRKKYPMVVAVERDGLLVLHTSDHGSPFPFAKTTLYEAGVRVPLVARWPGTVEPGRRSGALVSLADVLPTLLELGGATPPSGLDGRSFAELLRGEREDHRDSIFLSHTSHRVKPDVPSRALRRERWKYVRNLRPSATFLNAVMRTSASWRAIEAAAAGDDALAGRIARLRQRPPEELYDLEVDPFELSNLAGAAAHAATLDALRKELRAELERQSAPLLGEW